MRPRHAGLYVDCRRARRKGNRRAGRRARGPHIGPWRARCCLPGCWQTRTRRRRPHARGRLRWRRPCLRCPLGFSRCGGRLKSRGNRKYGHGAGPRFRQSRSFRDAQHLHLAAGRDASDLHQITWLHPSVGCGLRIDLNGDAADGPLAILGSVQHAGKLQGNPAFQLEHPSRFFSPSLGQLAQILGLTIIVSNHQQLDLLHGSLHRIEQITWQRMRRSRHRAHAHRDAHDQHSRQEAGLTGQWQGASAMRCVNARPHCLLPPRTRPHRGEAIEQQVLFPEGLPQRTALDTSTEMRFYACAHVVIQFSPGGQQMPDVALLHFPSPSYVTRNNLRARNKRTFTALCEISRVSAISAVENPCTQ